MRAHLIEVARSAIALGLSPWILPLIAIAAKRKAYDEDGACCARLRRAWVRMKGNAGDATLDDGAPDHAVSNKAINARLKAMIRRGWPSRPDDAR